MGWFVSWSCREDLGPAFSALLSRHRQKCYYQGSDKILSGKTWDDCSWLLCWGSSKCIEQKVRKDLRYCTTFRNLQGTAKRVYFESPVEHLQKDWENTIMAATSCGTPPDANVHPLKPIRAYLQWPELCRIVPPPQWIESRILFMWFLVLHVPCSKPAKKTEEHNTTELELDLFCESFLYPKMVDFFGWQIHRFGWRKHCSSQQKEPQSSFKKLSQIS